MKNNEKKQADEKPCLRALDSKPKLNSMQNSFFMEFPGTSYGFDDQQQQEENSSSLTRTFNEIFRMLDLCNTNENEIPGTFKYMHRRLPGYRFVPNDDKLVKQYLRKKIVNEPMYHCFVRDVNLYQHHPKDLAESYPRPDSLVDEWYFFSPRDRKYPNGTRPKRAAGNGYWKATGADRPVEVNDETVGFRQALVYYEGKPSKGVKTNWIMHEYKVVEKRERSSKDDMRLDDWVLCRIYCKKEKLLNEKDEEEKEEEEEIDEEGKEEEEEKDEEEKEEAGPSSKSAEANQDEEYKVPKLPSYGADEMIISYSGFSFPPEPFFGL